MSAPFLGYDHQRHINLIRKFGRPEQSWYLHERRRMVGSKYKNPCHVQPLMGCQIYGQTFKRQNSGVGRWGTCNGRLGFGSAHITGMNNIETPFPRNRYFHPRTLMQLTMDQRIKNVSSRVQKPHKPRARRINAISKKDNFIPEQLKSNETAVDDSQGSTDIPTVQEEKQIEGPVTDPKDGKNERFSEDDGVKEVSPAEDPITLMQLMKEPKELAAEAKVVNCSMEEPLNKPGRVQYKGTIMKNDKFIPEQLNSNRTPVDDSQGITDTPIVQEEIEGQVTKSKDVKVESRIEDKYAKEISHVEDPVWGVFEKLLERYDDKEKAAFRTEKAKRISEHNNMLAHKKLSLVLDLDHTLLNSVTFDEVESAYERILRMQLQEEQSKPQKHLFCIPHLKIWTKLRPGIWSFLEKASKLYELHICTMGKKEYATEMAKLLDPKGVMFAGRVISKRDGKKVHHCKDLEGVLGMESSVVIIDDTEQVWPHNKPNLVRVERYHFFPASIRQFGLTGHSLLERGYDESLKDGTLASSLAFIETVHRIFYSKLDLQEADVRNTLTAEQKKILAGCYIVFSGIFPMGEAIPQQHYLWQTATRLGAVCTTQIHQLVTHVVAKTRGTDKVNWAMSNGRSVVNPGWLQASAVLYRRASEKDFALTHQLC